MLVSHGATISSWAARPDWLNYFHIWRKFLLTYPPEHAKMSMYSSNKEQ
jgi:hypothetical protein